MAYLLAEKDKDLNAALEYARMAKEKLPNDPGVMDTLGWVYYKKGMYDSAIAELNDCADKLKDNAIIHYHLGMAYYKANRFDRAKALLEKTLELDPKFEKVENVKTILKQL